MRASTIRLLAQTRRTLDEPPLLTTVTNGLARAVMNRPKALNAFNLDMVNIGHSALKQWKDDTSVGAVLFKSSSKNFCAGGDVVALAKGLMDGSPEAPKVGAEYFRHEYVFDDLLSKFEKPTVTFMTGHVLGGGFGISGNSAFRIATETTKIAMPETTIGLFPDVGAMFKLARMDGELGTYLALTSDRVSGAGTVLSGLASHFVNESDLAALEADLEKLGSTATYDSVEQVVLRYANRVPESAFDDAHYPRGDERAALDTAFASDKAETIVETLDALANKTFDIAKLKARPEQDIDVDAVAEWAAKTSATIKGRSPSSVKIALHYIRSVKELNSSEVFQTDARVSQACMNPEVHTDFMTGVKHLLIDKIRDRPATWSPPTLQETSDADIQRIYFDKGEAFEPLDLDANGPAHTQPRFHHYEMPSEKDVQDAVTGNIPALGWYAMTRPEIEDYFTLKSVWKGRPGVLTKVHEVLQRKTRLNGPESENTVSWIH